MRTATHATGHQDPPPPPPPPPPEKPPPENPLEPDEAGVDAIVPPVVTEKSTLVSEHNQVVFKVARDASKPEIKAAVEKLFNVKVKAVNTQVRKGKMKVFKNIRARQSDTKRAVVTLEEGHSIDVTTGL